MWSSATCVKFPVTYFFEMSLSSSMRFLSVDVILAHPSLPKGTFAKRSKDLVYESDTKLEGRLRGMFPKRACGV